MKPQNIDDLIAYASDVLAKKKLYEPVDVDPGLLFFKTKIEGEDWDKRFDARLARYVLSLQDTFDEILADNPPVVFPGKPPRIRVKLKEGSSVPWTQINEFAQSLITPMTPEHTFISVMTAIAGAAGYFFYSRWLRYREQNSKDNKEIQTLTEHEKTKLSILQVLQNNAELNQTVFQSCEKPPRILVQSMEEDDRISFIGSEMLTKREAKKSAPKRQKRTEEQTTYADGEYALDEIDYSMGEMVLSLSQDGMSVKAYTGQLNDEDAHNFFDNINQRQLVEDLPLLVNVQINIHHTSRRIKYGSIVGVGYPRDNKIHKKLNQIIVD